MLQSLDASEVDVIVPFSTPVLTAACAGRAPQTRRIHLLFRPDCRRRRQEL